jgi:lipopolysaccharide transport system permease protein
MRVPADSSLVFSLPESRLFTVFSSHSWRFLHVIKATFLSIIEKRELIWEMAMRDLRGLTKGSFLGWAWIIVNPLVQTAAYVIIVSFFLGTRLSEGSGPLDYAIYVLSGMVPWQILTKSLGAAPNLIRLRVELVKQVVYSIETLPMTDLIFSSVGAFVSLCLYFVLALVTQKVSWAIILALIPFVLLVLLILGVSWVFMIIGVVLKDLQELVNLTLALLVYLSPVIARPDLVGERAYRLIMYNPLSHVVVCFRDTFQGEFHPWSWAIFIGMTLAAVAIGGTVITKTKVLINEYI